VSSRKETPLHSSIRFVIFVGAACIAYFAIALLVLPAAAGTNTWTAIGPSGANNTYGAPFAVDPSSPSTIYSMVNGTTIMKTTDSGGHWQALATAPSNFKSLVIDPAAPATIYALGGTAQGLATSAYKSIDGGVTWARVLSAPYIDLLAIAPSRSSTLYAESNGAVLKSIDGAASWTKIGTVFDAWKLAIDPTNADVVYVGTTGPEAKIFKLTPGTDQLRQLPISFPAEAYVEALAVDPVTPSVAYATYAVFSGNDSLVEAGMFKTIDGGETWMVAQKWIDGQSPPSDPILDAMALAIDPSAPWRIFATTNGGVYMSSDAAASWVLINSGLSFPSWGIDIDRTGSILRTASYTGLFEYRLAPAAPEAHTAIEYGLTTVWDYGGYFSYFVATSPAEIAALDSGALDGCCGYLWQRTGETFDVWTSPAGGALPACRFFYATFSIDHDVSTLNLDHFYTPYAAECAAVRARPDWQFEGIAFYLRLPDADGHCPPGTNVLYRLYNDGRDGGPAHRFTTSAATIGEMLAIGWIVESNGPTSAFACVPSPAPPSTL
jgi:photosystem II stability/assembly factor-like uncharacterized protein